MHLKKKNRELHFYYQQTATAQFSQHCAAVSWYFGNKIVFKNMIFISATVLILIVKTSWQMSQSPMSFITFFSRFKLFINYPPTVSCEITTKPK